MSYNFDKDVPIVVAFGLSKKEENNTYITRFSGSGERLDLIESTNENKNNRTKLK